MFVVDASVHIADMRPSELHHPAARAFMDTVRQSGMPIYGPIIVLAEIAGGLARGTGRADLARREIRLLQRLPNFVFVPVDEALGRLAAETAAAYQIRGCDALYVALAQQLDATLVTLDAEQGRRGLAVVTTQTPEAALNRFNTPDQR